MSSPQPVAVPPVRSLFKNVAQSSAVYTFAFVLQRIVGVLMLPIVTRYLTPADYGILDLIDQSLTIISMLLVVRFSAALGYFYFQSDSPEARRPVVGTTIFGAALMGGVAALLLWPFAPQMSQLVFGNASSAVYFRIALLTWPCGFALEVLYSLLRVEDRPGMYTVSSVANLLLKIGTVLLFVAGLKLRVRGVLYSGLLAGTVITLLMMVDAFRKIRPAFSFSMLLKISKFAMPLGFGGMAGFILNFGDRLIIPRFRPMAELGFYVLAYKIGMMLSFLYGAFDTYWSSQVFKIMKRDDSEWVYSRMFTYVVLGSSAAALVLVALGRPALRIMVAPSYYAAIPLVPLIVLIYFIRAIGDFLRSRFMVAGRTGADAIANWAGAIVCAAGYWLLIPRFGVWGAAWATLFGFTVIAGTVAVWTRSIQRYRIEAVRLAKIGIALTGAVLPCILIPVPALLGQIGIALVSLAIFPVLLWISRFATPGELASAQSAVRSAVTRFHETRQRVVGR